MTIKLLISSWLLAFTLLTSVNGEEKPTPTTNPVEIALSGGKLSGQEAEELEKKLNANPTDLPVRTKLLGYYLGKESPADKQARQKHVLWIVKNAPAAEIAGRAYVSLDRHVDKTVIAEAKAEWLKQIDANPQNTAILGNAAKFLLIHDADFAERLLQKSKALEPENAKWPDRLSDVYRFLMVEASGDKRQSLAAKFLVEVELANRLSVDEIDRFYRLGYLSEAAFEAGDSKKAHHYAEELLRLAPRYRENWNYGNAIHRGNLILGRIALASGDLKSAKAYLLKAGKTPGSPQLGSFGPSMYLAKQLLEKGERRTVLKYFELCSKFWKLGSEKLNEWKKLVEAEKVPDFGPNLSY